jgi:hypothetical protein
MDSGDVKLESKDNVDRILAELEKGDKGSAADALKDIGASASTPKTDRAGNTVLEVFQCPECGADVPSTSNTCPKCGVMFEEAQMYQCPLCNALMDATATTCPGCGASFESVEGESAQPPAAEPAKAEPLKASEATPAAASPPIQLPKHSDVSPDVPKQEQPAPKEPEPPAAEPAPMSFVDRMKALRAQKEGGAAVQKPAIPSQPAAQPKPPQPAAQQPKAAQGPAPAPQSQTPPARAVPGPAAAPQQQPRAAPAAPAGAPQTPRPAASGDAMRQLPSLVAKIKDDFTLAKRLEIDMTRAKELINKAVAAGRERDLKAAVELVNQGEAEVERSFTGFITKEVVFLEKQTKDVQSSGVDVAGISGLLARARSASGERKWGESIAALEQVRANLNSIASEYFGAQKGLSSIKTIVDDAAALRIDLGEGRTIYEECLKATVRKDWDTAKMLADQCTEQFNKVLPAYIANEIRKAKTKLLEVKMMNISITKPVSHLKEANDHQKNGNFGAALHAVRQFRDSMAELGGV